MPPSPFRFAISASFTSEPIQRVIEFWGRRLGSEFETRFAPYNQPLQTLLDPRSVFAQNGHGLNVLLVRLEDLGGDERVATELIHVLRDSLARFSVPLVFCLCPPSAGSAPVSPRLRELLAASLQDTTRVQYLDTEEVARLYPVESPHDPDAERLARIPYSELYFCALGTALVRRAHALFTPPYKVIALDCDNTLWQGICGEDGPSGIVLDPPRRALQQFMLDQRDQGMLLVMNSKNNEPDVLETFAANPSMPLALRHFAAWRLNWESKADNLNSLAAELGLGIDSFILVDDNPKECAEVAGSLPEVLSLPLPDDISRTPEFLEHVWAFDRPVVTEEDRQRSAYYAQAQEFGREIQRAGNLAEFVAGLGLKVEVSPLSRDRLNRAAQLTQRTNQFNFTTIRRTEAELMSIAAECVTVQVADRFGEYGTVGLMIFTASPDSLDIDTFLLSCRVLGRGVEYRMLAWLGAEAVRRGRSAVVARLEPTPRNAPARQFLHAVGKDSANVWRFDARSLCGLEWSPATSDSVPRPTEASRIQRRAVDYAAIAGELATPEQILEAMRRTTLPAGHDGMSEVERQLAGIWSDLLKRPSITLTDNFFDLGGHSLVAVLLIVRVREVFGVELSIDDVYSATLTLGELARKVEAYQTGQMNPDEYDALLAEIEGLSDEEVQALLAGEDPGVSPAS